MWITPDMTIDEVLQRYPETIVIFARHGVECPGCCAASYDNIAQGAQIHKADLDQLLQELNALVVTRN